jgi:uncharacterized protein with FMN-binding domain
VKRVLFSITATVVGLVALLDFKSHTRPVGVAVGAPVAPTQPTTSPTPRHRATHKTAPQPTTRSKSGRTSTHSSASGRFVGSAVQTQYGVVQVAVLVNGGRITKVSLPQLTAYDQTSQMINSQAAPLLVQETMSAQSAHIDSISGASYTSAGYIQSLQSALDRAGLK